MCIIKRVHVLFQPFKADMKSYIPLETAARPVRTGAENYKTKNSCPQWDSNPGPSAHKANALSVELLELRNIDHLKVTAFYLSFYVNYLYHVFTWFYLCYFLKFCRVFFSYNICIVLLFDLFKTFADCKELLKCITRQNILLHLLSGTGNF